MHAEDLVFWLDTLEDADDSADGMVSHGVLCRRHADSMVVPRNWTLDDLRDPDLHLFRPPAESVTARRTARRPARSGGVDHSQLDLDIDADDVAPTDDADPTEAGADGRGGGDPDTVDREAAVETWTPSFDDGDDLGGLLAARSPLLARAFRGRDRPRG